MREILFRLWHKHWKQMIYLTGFRYINEKSIQIYYKDEDGDFTTTSVNLEDVVIEQYTGLKDKNGKEIYEGDVVYFSVFDYNGLDTQYSGIVKFANGKWEIWNNEKDEYYDCDGAFDLYWVKEQDDELEIIGNIRDNPEFLEVPNGKED